MIHPNFTQYNGINSGLTNVSACADTFVNKRTYSFIHISIHFPKVAQLSMNEIFLYYSTHSIPSATKFSEAHLSLTPTQLSH